MKMIAGALLLVFLLSPLVSFADESVASCLQIPESFMSWRLLSTDENKYRIVRHFQHPQLPNCQGSSIALLDGCKESLVVKIVLTIDASGVYTEVVAALRMLDNNWKEGVGIDVQYGVYLEIKEVAAVFTLDASPPITRKIRILELCE